MIILLMIVLISYICFRIVFYISDKEKAANAAEHFPKGKIYEPYYEKMEYWIRETQKLPCEEVEITSFDGLKLRGRYYECEKGAPMEIMFHGYRGTAVRDLCGGVQRCFKLGRNALVVEQRASCGSEGNVISFGINEHRDCLRWVQFAVEHFGKDVKIILTGISMGASTVLMAAGRKLPPNVIGVLADCGFSSAKEIIIKCARDLRLPGKAVYPFVKLGARLFGRFNPDEYSPLMAMETCKIPVIFFHGENDAFVPKSMSEAVYEKCPTKKKLVLVPKAGHGISYLLDPKGYLETLAEFFK